MKISTKGHYAVQALVDIASQPGEEPISLSVIATRQNLSQNYLEQLFVKMRKGGLVKSTRGPGGGYLLARQANKITIGSIFEAVEENIALTDCVDDSGHRINACEKSDGCKTQSLWSALCQHFNELLYQVTLADVVDEEIILPPAPKSGIFRIANFS